MLSFKVYAAKRHGTDEWIKTSGKPGPLYEGEHPRFFSSYVSCLSSLHQRPDGNEFDVLAFVCQQLPRSER